MVSNFLKLEKPAVFPTPEGQRLLVGRKSFALLILEIHSDDESRVIHFASKESTDGYAETLAGPDTPVTVDHFIASSTCGASELYGDLLAVFPDALHEIEERLILESFIDPIGMLGECDFGRWNLNNFEPLGLQVLHFLFKTADPFPGAINAFFNLTANRGPYRRWRLAYLSAGGLVGDRSDRRVEFF